MLNINRTADYVVLWKSHKRAEWAAVGLDGQAAELRQRLESGVNLDLSPAVAQLTPPRPVTDTAVAVLPPRELAAAAPAVGLAVAAVPAESDAAAELELLEAESRRMWKLHAELGVELSQVARLLTAAQRQSAEKVLQQWAETGAGS